MNEGERRGGRDSERKRLSNYQETVSRGGIERDSATVYLELVTVP